MSDAQTLEIFDESDEWTDEDYADFTLSSFAYFEETENFGDEGQ